MFNTAKADMIVGSTTTVVVSGFAWTQEILPIISTIGVIAGTIVALHGLGTLAYNYYKLWRRCRCLKKYSQT